MIYRGWDHDLGVEPREAFTAMQAGAVLIDIRTDRQRGLDGKIPGAVAIDRMVLEWRVDPASGATHQAITSLDVPLMLLCAQGYCSSLAAASLLDLGARSVSDVIGGFDKLAGARHAHGDWIRRARDDRHSWDGV